MRMLYNEQTILRSDGAPATLRYYLRRDRFWGVEAELLWENVLRGAVVRNVTRNPETLLPILDILSKHKVMPCALREIWEENAPFFEKKIDI